MRKIFFGEEEMRQPIDRLALIFVLAVFAGLAIYRALHLWFTGFYVSDEFGYVMTAINGSYFVWNHIFTYMVVRPFFLNVNFVTVQFLNARTAAKFAAYLPFYLVFWNSLTLLSAYGIMKSLKLEPRAIAVSLIGSLFLVTLVVLGQGFLTEALSLGMAMLGLYLLVLYSSTNRKYGVFFTFLAALAFGGAALSREPYQIFLVIGPVLILMVSLLRFRKGGKKPYYRKLLFLILPVLLFVSGWIVVNNTPFFTTYQPPIYVLPTGQVTTAQARTVTETLVSTSVITTAGTTKTIVSTIKTTMVTATTTEYGAVAMTKSVSPEKLSDPINVIAGNLSFTHLQRTAAMFFGGLLLGWNPILGISAIIGFFLLLKLVLKRKDDTHTMAFGCALLGFLQFFVVSAMMMSDPNVPIIRSLSTIIRYSQLSVPAYFLSVPFFFQKLNKRFTIALFIILMVFSLSAAGTYSQYLQSHLSDGYPYSSGQQIFTLDYRTPFARLRDDIISSHRKNVVVLAEADMHSDYDNTTMFWSMVPGTDVLPPVKFYPYLSETQFISMKFTEFYIYSEGYNATERVIAKAPYLASFINGNSSDSPSPSSLYQVEKVETVHRGTDGFLIFVRLRWNS